LRGRFSKRYGVYRRRYNHAFDKEFNSPNALNVRRPEDLKWKENPMDGEIKEERNPGGWMW
jgi:hypothetical protein